MDQNNELEKYLEYGLSGTPEIKGEEKKYWLGEFRERIIFALTLDQVGQPKAFEALEEKLKDPRGDQVIINNSLNQQITGKIMDLCNQYHKNFKSVDRESLKGKNVLVLASSHAVDERNVYMDETP